MRKTFALDIVLLDVFLHARQRQRARRFRNGAYILKQVFHGRANRIAVYRDDAIQIFLTQAECLIADTLHRHAFRKQPNARQIYRFTRVQRRFQAG